MQNRLFLLIVLFFIVTGGFAQHLIIKKNGDKIYCRIVQEDSTFIYYTKPAQKTTFQIDKAEVEKYYNSRTGSATTEPAALDPKPRSNNEILMLDFSVGQASPRGDFESQDLYSDKSGLAKRGVVVKAGLILKLSRQFGISASYRYQSNPFNDHLITSQLSTLNPGMIFTAKSSNWNVRGFFGGLYLVIPVDKIEGFSIDLDVAVGVPKCAYPELTIDANNNGRHATYTSYASDVSATAVTCGIGFKYRLNQYVGLNLNISYLQTKARFENVYTGQFNRQYYYSDYTQTINTLNVQGGLCFFLFQRVK